MARMRVHELAKELNMSSKELLERLAEMKIPAKSHASVLNDAYVQKIRKNLAPEEKAQAGIIDQKEAEELAREKADQAAKKAEEEAARRAAVEKERALREAERARRQQEQQAAGASGAFAGSTTAADEPSADHTTPRSAPSPYADLADQIALEKERVAREKAEAEAKARRAAIERDVEKKRAVEARLRGNQRPRQAASSVSVDVPSSRETAAPKPAAGAANRFDSLLSQIESEQQRIQSEKAAVKQNRRDRKQAAGSRRGRQHDREFEPDVPELTQVAASGEDRYAHMAVQAEKLQRDKVLAEARAAVAAASGEGEGRRRKRKEKREAEARERAEMEAIEKGLDPSLVLDDSVVEIPQGATVQKFAELLDVAPNDIVKRLFMLGQALTLTQSMSDDLIELIADDMNRKVRVVSPEEEFAVVYNDRDEDLKPRPPVVTVMGHVDHGKTSLLDAIRHTGVAEREAGGITQAIGASVVNLNGRQVTFIDTPGHEAFTAMRARGAKVTDVVVLVVAADDGVMPQTIEAINHAKAAGVPIVVAGNKRLHIDDLLEAILVQADVLELKANPDALASGYVIEANLDKGRGPVATVLVERGTLRPGDTVVAGTSYGRVRALVGTRGQQVEEAKPSDPVEILGLGSVAAAGDEFRVFEDERDARKLAEERALRARLKAQESRHMSLDELFSHIEEGKTTELNLVVKADVMGSIEALRDAFGKMDQSEVKINIIHAAVGGITETDITLAAASDAIIIGFNVRPTGKSRTLAEKEKVDIRLYRVIYQAIEDINAARVGLLSPDIVEKDTGIVEVRETFKVPKAGTVAGGYVVEGEISRDDKVRIVRDGTVVFEGAIASLRRFKDDVKTVRSGYECGIQIEGYQDIKVGDTIEGYQVVEVERTE